LAVLRVDSNQSNGTIPSELKLAGIANLTWMDSFENMH
jgi:hypothetical protein